MIVNKSWVIKNGALYQPKRVIYEFLWIELYVMVCVLPGVFLRSNFDLLLFIFLPVFWAFKLFREIRKFGWLGEPVVVIKKNAIEVNAIPNKSMTISLYDDDEIHIIGAAKFRYIRLVNEKQGNRELRLSYSIIKYIVNRLKKTHCVIEDDYPSMFSRIRGDY